MSPENKLIDWAQQFAPRWCQSLNENPQMMPILIWWIVLNSRLVMQGSILLLFLWVQSKCDFFSIAKLADLICFSYAQVQILPPTRSMVNKGHLIWATFGGICFSAKNYGPGLCFWKSGRATLCLILHHTAVSINLGTFKVFVNCHKSEIANLHRVWVQSPLQVEQDIWFSLMRSKGG